jgi:uncharacterized SAM-binding protein YcdF (DUF218 family)
MFVLKKIVQLVLQPLSLIAILGLIALLGRRRSRLWGGLALGLFLICGFGWGVDAGLSRLEQASPAFETAWRAAGSPPVDYIVVLGGGQRGGGISALSRLTPYSLARLNEGLRLGRILPGSKVVLAGGSVFAREPEAEIMRRAAIELGFDPTRLLSENLSRDTDDQARMLAPMLRGHTWVLVTSAAHLPRSLRLFEAQGVKPIAAPTDYRVDPPIGPYAFFPRAINLESAEILNHELLGLIWLKLRPCKLGA